MKRMPRNWIWGLAVASAVTLSLAACSGANGPSRAVKGGTVTFAEPAGAVPNYIFPMQPGAYLTDANRGQFSSLMYLPLYWLGAQGHPVVNSALSVAQPPVFSANNTRVTVTLKHWSWSNGQPITARDVIFWMNLVSAASDPNAPAIGSSTAPGPGWGDAVSGGFPENVVSYTQTGTYTLVLHLNRSYNPTWYLDNELTQIYPLPTKAWDQLSSGGAVGSYDASAQPRVELSGSAGAGCPSCYVPANPGTATTGALGVAQFLNSQSQNISTYVSNPLWRVVDGPFRLQQFTPSGFVKMVPNPAYSGSPKPSIAAFEEVPFTTDTAEFNALKAGSLTIGYLPPQDLAQRATLARQQGYRYSPWYVFGINVMAYNFTDPSAGPIFSQLYFRQAFQALINQAQYIKAFENGVGTVENGPVPTYPSHDPYVSPLEAGAQVYPYSPATAVRLLQANGWAVNPGGVSVCRRPGSGAGQCGPGVKAGQPATFGLLYASGSPALTNVMEAMQSTMKAAAGITLNLSQASVSQTIATAFNGCTPATPCSGWQIVDWYPTDGWTWLGGLPTGGVMFSIGGANAGDYSSPTNLANIAATHVAPNQPAEIQAMFKYEDYVLRQAAFAMLPNLPYQLTVYKSNLRGLVPQGVFTEIYPQYYSLSS